MTPVTLNGKVIIVTGGAGLLGMEFAKTILDNGGVCALADIDEKKGEKALRDLKRKFGAGRVDFVKLDITSKKSVTHMIDTVLSKFKKIDVLINNAYPRNKNYGKKFEDVTYKDFCGHLNSHLGGYFLTSQQTAAIFKKQSYGNIINIASIYGIVAPRFEIYKKSVSRGREMTLPVEYAAAKSAIIQITRYMAKYFRGWNIRVNSVSPGGVFDKQTRAFCKKYNTHGLSKGLLDKSDMNGTILYLLSDMSQFVNGQNIVVDDGWTL